MTTTQNKRVMVVAGEASGDLHGAKLVRAMKSTHPELRFCGVGGAELDAAGVEILYDAAKLSVVGITEVFSHLRDIINARGLLIERMKKEKPALLVLIDFPDFNLFLAAKAKKLGIPILYYISPQVWAWRSNRVKKIGQLSDKIGVILPFEKEFYAQRGVKVDFVGHPLMDTVSTTMPKNTFLAKWSISSDKKIVGLIPGSRKKEIASLLPDFLQSAVILAKKMKQELVFLLPKAPTISRKLFNEYGLENYQEELDIHVINEDRYDLMAACDAVIAASGTVTLELAILGTPLVAAYRVSPRTYRLGRLLVRLDSFSLVNLIGGGQIIPELLQDEVTPENIACHLAALINDPGIRQTTLIGLKKVKNRLGPPGASKRAANLGLELMGLSADNDL